MQMVKKTVLNSRRVKYEYKLSVLNNTKDW